MYEKFYGLTEKPFSLLPDPEFLVLGKKHGAAYTALEYGLVSQAGFTVVTGEVGSGKTTLIRHLLNQLDEDITVGLVSSSHHDMGELLQWLLFAFNLDYRETHKVGLYDLFTQFLIDQYANNKRTVLIIDEAQNLQPDVLEELRLLSNINADKHQVLQIILVGQPQLRSLLKHRDLLQFQQRISVDYHLQALNEDETRYYIFQRLKFAGRNKPLFTRNAINLIYKTSHGIPRIINTLCDTSLVYGFADQKLLLDSALVAKVLKDKHAAVEQPDETPAAQGTHPFNQQPSVASEHQQSAADINDHRITSFNRESAKLLFKKYYNKK
ncbi:MAG: AAA family ATPase [Candidatus Thiodiazotropha endolucinida]|nr:AAA family ATPase [Candidatus Thiodiazotropha sp. (ex Codakia orbicularis)]MCG7876781.1 AAA family ATPase [Candidatus Thiodiazotropha taylori]MCG8025753.1 AAA family ATPase [Candidatus Thiodiazotropha endolucinida]MCG7886597.1 AAA family ATPase [Candidatus Thiodiazotropha taylori]MCG7952774.1 AAA family ATPase [Candidatus Thiodiazotropha taylori]